MANTKRPPIVTILGHVDHGKTSILDAIRHTQVQLHETGGITQHIGAYQITFQDQLITFIDTPGHQAFSAMRARGGSVADVAILVVAADDGVMPQTKESISHINHAKIPFIVAINKIDIPGVNTQTIKAQLAEAGVFVEGYGGSVPVVEVSAKVGTNLDLLLETILLLSDMNELVADPDTDPEALIIESSIDRFKGPLATLIVKNGTFINGQEIVALNQAGDPTITATGKIRAMISFEGQTITKAPPSTPIQVLGFVKVPPVGSPVVTASFAKAFGSGKEDLKKPNQAKAGEYPVIIKADVAGTLEAIISNLPEGIAVIFSDTGAVNESDILLALTTGAKIIAFRINVVPAAKKLAKVEHIDILAYATIYELFDDLKLRLLQNQKPPEEIILGQAKVKKLFSLPNLTIIGAVATSGKLSLGDQIKIAGKPGITAAISSLKIGHDDQKEIKKDQEFGFTTSTPLDIKPGDVIMSFKLSA